AIAAIPTGQTEAAAALGMTRWQQLRLVLLPQALRTALPAMTNDLISLLKDSSLVSVITVVELTKQMTITAVDVRSWALPGLACAALYFAMSYPLARIAARLCSDGIPIVQPHPAPDCVPKRCPRPAPRPAPVPCRGARARDGSTGARGAGRPRRCPADPAFRRTTATRLDRSGPRDGSAGAPPRRAHQRARPADARRGARGAA